MMTMSFNLNTIHSFDKKRKKLEHTDIFMILILGYWFIQFK